ncbi:hypothetical protein IPZ70_01935 [Streptomyces polychromogenes]|nr:hypothetical protein [Streptomyces polychromogenes]
MSPSTTSTSKTTGPRNVRAPNPKASALNPGFELYDNTGRDAEQIHSHATGSATTADLDRWARRDAAGLLARHRFPEPPLDAPDLRPYLKALDEAATPVEAAVITSAVLNASEAFVGALSDYLLAAGHRYQHNERSSAGSPRTAAWRAASGLLASLGEAARAVEITLRQEYDTPARPGSHPGQQPPAPPPNPASGPTAPRR